MTQQSLTPAPRFRASTDRSFRVITHLASDVETVVGILRGAFSVDDSRSLDKHAALDPDRFGYLSHHLVAKLSPARSTLPEWSSFEDFDFEVQVRSVLQHAWAEIEHDLGYKSVTGIPSQLRRRFARLAGLLELADAEFDAISADVATHVAEVEAALARGNAVEIDRDSVRALIAAENAVSTSDRAIASSIGAVIEDQIGQLYTDARLKEMSQVGLRTTSDILNAMESEGDSIARFARDWLDIPEEPDDDGDLPDNVDEEGRYTSLSPGISLFYLYIHRMIAAGRAEELSFSDRLTETGQMVSLIDIHAAAFGSQIS